MESVQSRNYEQQKQAILRNFQQQTDKLMSSKERIAEKRRALMDIFAEIGDAVDDLRRREQETGEKESDLQREKKELEEELDDYKRKLDKAEDEEDKLNKELADLKKKYDDCTKSVAETSDARRALQNDLEELNRTLEQTRTLYGEEKQNLLNDLEALKDDLVQQIQQLEQQNTELVALKTKFEQEGGDCASQLKEAEDKIKELNDKKDDLKDELESLQEELDQTKEQHEIAKAALEDCKRDKEALQAEIDELKSENNKLERKLENLDEEFGDILNEIEQTKKDTIDASVVELAEETEALDSVVNEARRLLRKFSREEPVLSRRSRSFTPISIQRSLSPEAPSAAVSPKSAAVPRLTPIVTPSRRISSRRRGVRRVGSDKTVNELYDWFKQNNVTIKRALPVRLIAERTNLSESAVENAIEDLLGNRHIVSGTAVGGDYGDADWNQNLIPNEIVYWIQ